MLVSPGLFLNRLLVSRMTVWDEDGNLCRLSASLSLRPETRTRTSTDTEAKEAHGETRRVDGYTEYIALDLEHGRIICNWEGKWRQETS